MGLSTSEFLEMEWWQYNAYSLAWKDRKREDLAVAIQGAWMTAYWSGPTKHKKSLKQVLKALRGDEELPREPIDKKAAEKSFKQFEELQKNGWTKV